MRYNGLKTQSNTNQLQTAGEAMRKKGDERTGEPNCRCEKCGRWFYARRWWSRFCTADCRVNAFRGRPSKWEREIKNPSPVLAERG